MPEGSPFGPGSPFEEFFRRFGMPEGDARRRSRTERRSAASALGSGFVIEHDGYIVTNNHVVDSAATVKVRLVRRARVRRRGDRHRSADRPRADQDRRRPACPSSTLGDSDALRVGEDVIAVGNPFGLGGTVTRGIVSAMARDINAGPYVDFIQTDAAINRGNSGGPLLNLEGEVIGVNSAIYSPNGGSVGVGFAIPSNTVQTVIAQLQRRRLGRARLARRDHPAGDPGDRRRDRPRRPARRARRRRGRGRPLGRQARDRRRDPHLRRQARRVRAASCRSSSPPSPPTPRSRSRCCARASTRPSRCSSAGSTPSARPRSSTGGAAGRGHGVREARRHAGDRHPDRPRAARPRRGRRRRGHHLARRQGHRRRRRPRGRRRDPAGRQRGGDAPRTTSTHALDAATNDAVLIQIERQGAKIFVGVRLA